MLAQSTNALSDPLTMRMGVENGGGASRRKKSKPTRMFVDLELDVERACSLPTGSRMDETPPVAAAEMTSYDEVCDLCQANFSTQQELQEHMEQCHHMADEPTDKEEVTPLTKYHQAGLELQQEVGLNGTGSVSPPLPIVVEPVETPLVAPVEEAVVPPGAAADGEVKRGANNQAASIFHEDAYCNLCSREFCNKYFLKTHLANKHGIYDSPPPQQPQAPVTSSENTTVFPGVQFGVTKQPDIGKPDMSIAFNNVVPPPTMTSSLATDAAAAAASLPAATSAKAFSTPLTVPSVTPTKSVMPLKDAPKTPVKDMEDYCEICQKHFCNKYYLKKHKHDVHGIVPDTPPSKRGRPPTISREKNGAESHGMGMAGLQAAAQGLLPQTSQGPNALTSMANVMFINPLAQPFILQPPAGGLQGAPQGILPPIPPPPGLPTPLPSQGDIRRHMAFDAPPVGIAPSQGGFQPYSSPHVEMSDPGLVSSGVTTNPALTAASQTQSSSPNQAGNIPLPNDALRSIGVLNADAYCEICRKEFCNKYFLKIHKANKHGVYDMNDPIGPVPGGTRGPDGSIVPPGLLPPIPPGLGLLPPGAHGPNLPADLAAAIKKEAEEREARADPKTKTGDEEDFCKFCQKDFASKYSLKIHMINVHGKKPEDADVAFDLSKDKQSEVGAILNGVATPEQSAMFNNMMAAKLADRVVCDLCNKEVCNKYFLRTHKLKVHGVADDSLGEEPKMTSSEPAQGLVKADGSVIEGLGAAKPDDRDLLKMGIDPEAYCDICKKEFCSKYFLKTHKMNIHGIKCEGSQPTMNGQSKMKDLINIANNNTAAAALATSIANSVLAANSTQATPGLLPSVPPPPLLGSMAPPTEMAGSKDARSEVMDNGNNNSKVVCHLCNKEVVNKFFLKTHMLAKHKVDYDPMSPSTLQNNNLESAGEIPSDLSAGSWNHVTFRCMFCDVTCADSTQLQMHLIRDHSSQRRDGGHEDMDNSIQRAASIKKKYTRRLRMSHGLKRLRKGLFSGLRRKMTSSRHKTEQPSNSDVTPPVVVARAQHTTAPPTFIMQQFKLAHDDDQVVSSFVQLPVRRMINQPARLTFTLTPMDTS